MILGTANINRVLNFTKKNANYFTQKRNISAEKPNNRAK